jgi:hypothetical protein
VSHSQDKISVSIPDERSCDEVGSRTPDNEDLKL